MQENIGKYVVVRTNAAGVHYGVLKEYDPATRHATLTESRRLWYWNGAFTLSAVAKNGVKQGSKIAADLDSITISQVEEILPATPKAEKSLREFEVYEA